ncbi:hypothetical protein [Qipengyuania marisflavi]|uniref:Uncharacterized protein n=1 Tax=Qipengyuania marisflavi TaxID=2486356 RepID=A0A5S3P693_9SPHN|nr:hypothetical protein [Qipengyuania marisflavi]TMM48351.1 hypothetical protein FEV51_08720 [Qipengyuania marisflavi]
MIDYFALALTHGLLLLAVLRIVMRDALDSEDPLAGAEPDATGADDAPEPLRRNRRKRAKSADRRDA